MLKPVVAATAMFAIAGSSLVYAQERFGGHDGMRPWRARAEHRYRPSAQDLAAFTDARIAALKAGLELTPDQAKAWPPFEQALRDLAQIRVQRIEARRALAQQGAGQSQPLQSENPGGPFARLQRRADNLTKTATALKKVADAGAPLYQSLTDAQKERFKVLARILRPHARFVAFNERRRGLARRSRIQTPPAAACAEPRRQRRRHQFAALGRSICRAFAGFSLPAAGAKTEAAGRIVRSCGFRSVLHASLRAGGRVVRPATCQPLE